MLDYTLISFPFMTILAYCQKKQTKNSFGLKYRPFQKDRSLRKTMKNVYYTLITLPFTTIIAYGQKKQTTK